METWRDIEGYIELYQVSNLGRVKNVHTSRVLKNILTKDGYYVAVLYKQKKVKDFLFIG